MRFVICILAFVFFLLIGFSIFNRYKSRKVFFENLVSFCDHILLEIGFQNNTISKIIDLYIASYGGHLRSVLIIYQNLISTRQDITRDRIHAILNKNLCKPNEISMIADFFCELGRHGVDGEKHKTVSARNAFETVFTDAAQKLKSDATVYFKLFVFMGIAAVILCV